MGPEWQAFRTGFSGKTMAAEESYNPSTELLCMVGCLGGGYSGLDHQCGWQISLYFPRIFSLAQRTFVAGTMVSMGSALGSQSRFVFQLITPDGVLDENPNINTYSNSHLSYKYSKMVRANVVGMKARCSKLEVLFKRWVQKYPKLESQEDVISLSNLSEKLHVNSHAIPSSFQTQDDMVFVRIEVISLGSFLGNPFAMSHCDCKNTPGLVRASAPSHQVLNVSLQLTFTEVAYKNDETSYKNISGLSLEGLYDSLHGKMYLTGCRKVLPNAATHPSTVRGQDCLIEVTLQYPSKTARWLMDPAVKLSITSQRSQEDPLYFNSINLRMVDTRRDVWDVLFRKAAEGILRIVILLGMITVFLSQILHIKKRPAATPYVSQVMMGLQLYEYFCLLTVDDAECLFKSYNSGNYKSGGRGHEEDYRNGYESVQKIINLICKVLVLVAFLLALKIYIAIRDSRASLQSSISSNAGASSDNVAVREKLVTLTSLFMFLATLGITFMVCHLIQVDPSLADILYYCIFRPWNFFLFPQMVGNLLWQHQHVAPLSRTYYLGLTFMRILGCMYNGVFIGPVLEPCQFYNSKTMERDVKKFLARSWGMWLGNIAAVLVMILLAVVVHVQQRRLCRTSKLD
ncbi:hypothetical protein QQ045_012703 [Rhodiola kirilowii]